MPNPPKPTALKIVQGTLRKDRANPREPKPAGALGAAPDWFSDLQRQYWDHALRSAPKGLLTQLDSTTLVSYCVAAAAFEETTQFIQKTGRVVKGSTGTAVLNPGVRAQALANAAMMKAASEMGFTPSSRARVSVGEESAEDDPWARMAGEQ
jgi:P27 family predicted phage terminase small subunit